MIELMYEYTTKLQERVSKKNHEDATLVPDSAALNLQSVSNDSSSGDLEHFTNRRMAVMMMMMTCVDSATAGSGNDWNLLGVVREVATSLMDEVIIVEEAWNSIIVAAGSYSSQPTGTPVAQLLELNGQVTRKVRNTY